MKAIRFLPGLLVLAALGTGGWVLIRHPEWVKGEADEDEDAAEVAAEVPVKMGKVARATVRRHVECFGTVEALPAASARVASPVAGILAGALCTQGQRVEKGALLFQLDERAANVEEEKAAAAVGSARASLARLKAFPRPDQIKVAEMQADRAKRAVEYSRKKNERLVKLLADQLASEKNLQEAELELISAQNDLAVAEKQLLLLKSSPAPEEIAEAESKVVEAGKALAGAKAQRSLLGIPAPLSGTILRVRVNPGEAVDLATVLAEIVDLDRLCVEGTIPAAELRSVAAGMEVDLGAVRGKIDFVGLDVDRKNDAGFVRVSLPAKTGLPVGQSVRLRIVVEEHKDRLVVPRRSVVTNAEGKTVIVGFLGEKAIMKEVKVGLKEGDLVEIEGEEIDEGDRIVTEGAYGLPGEAKVRDSGKD